MCGRVICWNISMCFFFRFPTGIPRRWMPTLLSGHVGQSRKRELVGAHWSQCVLCPRERRERHFLLLFAPSSLLPSLLLSLHSFLASSPLSFLPYLPIDWSSQMSWRSAPQHLWGSLSHVTSCLRLCGKRGRRSSQAGCVEQLPSGTTGSKDCVMGHQEVLRGPCASSPFRVPPRPPGLSVCWQGEGDTCMDRRGTFCWSPLNANSKFGASLPAQW